MSFRHKNSPRFRGFPLCVCLVVIFFTLKTRVFIAKITKNRERRAYEIAQDQYKNRKYYIAQDWNNDDRNPCPYLPSVPILAGHPDFRPSNLNWDQGSCWDVRFSLLMIKKKTIIITDPGNRHYGNRKSWEKVQSTHYHVTCQLFIIKATWISWSLQLHKKRGANKQLRFQIFVRDSRKILVGPKCPYTHAVKYQPWNCIPVQTELITLYRQRKKYRRAILIRKSTTRLSKERLYFSVIFMNIDLRKVKEIANWTYQSKLELLESCFGYQLSCAIFMNIGLRKVKEISKWIYLVNLSLLKDVSDINYAWFLGV